MRDRDGFPTLMTSKHVGNGPKNYRRSDERIREELCEFLTDDGAIDASSIEVRVSEGTVTLDGSVPDRHMKWLAEDLVTAVPRVREVPITLRTERPRITRSDDMPGDRC